MDSQKKAARSVRLRSLMVLAQALILLSICATRINAQVDVARAIERQEMNQQLLLTLLPPKQTESARLLSLKQIKEDFRDIQNLNNTMMAQAWSREELDYPYISDKVSQIKARAARLKTNLSLPEARDVEKKQIDPVVTDKKEFRAALLLLDRSIMSFVTNPLFQKSTVVEVGLATRASHDLDVVIKLGGNLQKTAGSLNKKSKK